jgi:hypothetical protein
LTDPKSIFPYSGKFKINMVLQGLKRGAIFSIDTSSYSKFIFELKIWEVMV